MAGRVIKSDADARKVFGLRRTRFYRTPQARRQNSRSRRGVEGPLHENVRCANVCGGLQDALRSCGFCRADQARCLVIRFVLHAEHPDRDVVMTTCIEGRRDQAFAG